MDLTQEQIKKLSKDLSKILINNEKLGKNINDVLKYIELLNEVNTTGIKPTISVVEKTNSLRKDIVINKHSKDTKELIKSSNAKVIGNQIAISNIMK